MQTNDSIVYGRFSILIQMSSPCCRKCPPMNVSQFKWFSIVMKVLLQDDHFLKIHCMFIFEKMIKECTENIHSVIFCTLENNKFFFFSPSMWLPQQCHLNHVCCYLPDQNFHENYLFGNELSSFFFTLRVCVLF